MNALQLKHELLALRASTDAKIDDLLQQLEREEEVATASPWMKIAAYAKHSQVSTKTVSRWIEEANPGPGKKHPWAAGTGKSTRVHRDDADAWRRMRR
jgi:hypothetical protein